MSEWVKMASVEDVLPVLGIGFEIGRLDFLADELYVARRQVLLDEVQVSIANVGASPSVHAKLPHVVCKNCGYYGGREAIGIE